MFTCCWFFLYCPLVTVIGWFGAELTFPIDRE